MICERCGRLLNRATGACNVCADHGGAAPPPVATTTAPAAPPTEVAQPISTAAAVAILDLGERPARPTSGVPAARPSRDSSAPSSPPPAPAEPPPPPRAPGASVGVVRGGRLGRLGRRRSVDAVAYDGCLVLARRGAPTNLLAPQLAAQDPTSRIIDGNLVDDVVVREDIVSGKATIQLRHGEVLSFTWPGYKNRGVAVENLLAHAFPGKVDQGPSEIAQRTVRTMAGLGIAILVFVGAFFGASALFESDPPPPPPPAPPATLPPVEQMVRAELQPVCPGWLDFANGVGSGNRPDPNAMRPVVDGMRGRFDAAAAAPGVDATYVAARDELGYLQDLARRPVDAVARESVSRVAYAMKTVSGACERATSHV